MNCLISLKPRTKEEVPAESTSFGKAVCVFKPVIAYYIIDMLFVMAGAMFIQYAAKSNQTFASFCEKNSSILSVIIKIIAMTAAIAPLIPMFLGESPVIVHREIKAGRYFLVAATGAAMALFLNLLFSITGFTGSSSEYAEVSQRQFSLPLLVGILLYGIFTPVVEEILFRGLVYNRLRRNYGLITALIGSAVLFGLYHQNVVQAVYGTILGLFLAWIYERYGCFVFPVIVHGVANTLIYMCMLIDVLKTVIMNGFAMILAGVIMIAGVIIIGKDDSERLS